MMRLSSTLIAIAAAVLLVCGDVASTTTEVGEDKTSLVQSNLKRLLRNDEAREYASDNSEEERGISWQPLKDLLPDSAKRLAAKADKEKAIIMKERDFFFEMAIRNAGATEISEFYRKTGRSKKTAAKMGRLYNKFKANPKAYA